MRKRSTFPARVSAPSACIEADVGFEQARLVRPRADASASCRAHGAGSVEKELDFLFRCAAALPELSCVHLPASGGWSGAACYSTMSST